MSRGVSRLRRGGRTVDVLDAAGTARGVETAREPRRLLAEPGRDRHGRRAAGGGRGFTCGGPRRPPGRQASEVAAVAQAGTGS